MWDARLICDDPYLSLLDPFGNYLCQKLLEYSTEEQRNVICESVANDLVGISLNMHGTRAVQKMIDFLSNPRQPNQIRSIILALSLNVVALIKDLNGNHVIQKCLNRLIPEDNQVSMRDVLRRMARVLTATSFRLSVHLQRCCRSLCRSCYPPTRMLCPAAMYRPCHRLAASPARYRDHFPRFDLGSGPLRKLRRP
jgi:hypothetical protein